MAGVAPPAKKPALSKLKALVEREGLDPAPDRRRVPLRQQAAAPARHGAAPAGNGRSTDVGEVHSTVPIQRPTVATEPPVSRPRPTPLYKSIYDIPSLPGQQATDAQRPGPGPLPRPQFALEKYPPPPPPPPQSMAAQRADLRSDDIFLAAAQPRQPAAAPATGQLAQRKVVQLSPAGARKGAAPAWVRRRAGIAAVTVAADEVMTL